MKRTKNLFFLLVLAFTVSLMSCDNQNADTTPQETNDPSTTSRLRFVRSNDFDTSGMSNWQEVSTMPDAIQSYLTENHANIPVVEAWKTQTGEYIILLEDDTVLVFNASEQFVVSFNLPDYEDHADDDFEEVDPATLPQAIQDYLSTNHADDPIDIAGQNTGDGEYVIVLESGLILIFDGEGNFIESFMDDDYEDDDYEDDFDEIAAADLPQPIKDYIANNHANDPIDEAGYDSVEEIYAVILDSGLILIFDKDGNFIESFQDDEDEEEEVSPADLPQAIKDYVASNYPNEQIVKAWLDSEEGEYIIELSNNKVLIFDTDGNFIEEDDEDDEDDEDGDDDDDEDDNG